jgi:hypothetical protein
MWFCFNDGFLSVVKDTKRPGHLQVRARKRQHIVNAFPDRVPISHTPKGDYRWRVSVPADLWAEVVAARIRAIDYDNFKNSVKEPKLKAMFSMWWFDHYRYQSDQP